MNNLKWHICFRANLKLAVQTTTERCKCEQEGREVIRRSAACWSCTSLISGDWLSSWFQYLCCSGQTPSTPDLPSGWLRERQGAWEETLTSCWECNLLLGYVASWLPSITAFTQNKREWKGLYIHAISCWWGRAVDAFWAERKRGKYHAEKLHVEKDKRKVAVKQNTSKNLLLLCYQNVI